MTYQARQIANWFVERAKKDDRTFSIMSLLKLSYIAHGWHLEIRGTPLFEDRIEAWQYGPVIPSVYKEFRKQGVDVKHPVAAEDTDFSPADESLLEQVYTNYGRLSAFQLSDLTHVHGGPWHIATQAAGGYYAHIPDDLIRLHYQAKRSKARKLSAEAAGD